MEGIIKPSEYWLNSNLKLSVFKYQNICEFFNLAALISNVVWWPHVVEDKKQVYTRFMSFIFQTNFLLELFPTMNLF